MGLNPECPPEGGRYTTVWKFCWHADFSGRLKVPVELLGKSAEELREFVASLGERPFRAAQLYHALYAERRFEFASMTNIPAALRERLASADGARITPPRI